MTELTPLEQLKLSRTPFPLETFIDMYIAYRRTCYVNYMEGTKLLYKWLSPISKPPTENIPSYSKLLGGYETQQLAIILAANTNTYRDHYNYIIHRTILSCQTQIQS